MIVIRESLLVNVCCLRIKIPKRFSTSVKISRHSSLISFFLVSMPLVIGLRSVEMIPLALSSEDSLTIPRTVSEKMSIVFTSPSMIWSASFYKIMIKFASRILTAVRWIHLTALDLISSYLSSKWLINAEQIFFSFDSSS